MALTRLRSWFILVLGSTLLDCNCREVSGARLSIYSMQAQTCLSLEDLITRSVTTVAISYFSDHPREDRNFEPSKIAPFTPSGLFDAYYGREASPVELQKAVVQIVFAAKDYKIIPADRDASRRNLHSYVSAGSQEYARKRAGELFRAIIEDYVKGTEQWESDSCIHRDHLESVLKAIEVEFHRIRNEVGDVKFGQFLSLGVGSTLAFAIDDTGSMSGEINAAKKRAQEIVKFTRGTLDAPQDFVLVPFNDPDVGPVTVTNDANQYHAALNKLYAHGGGDAPEMSMRGIQLAIENSRPGSVIYVITDETSKDYKLQDTVIAQAREKSIVVTFLLTNPLNNCPDDRGNKRCRTLYDHIARETGGKVLVISRSDIFRATDIVQSNAKQGLVLLKQVTRNENDAQGDDRIQEVRFPIDSKIQVLLLEAQGSCEDITLHGPGSNSPFDIRDQRFGDLWTGAVNFKANTNALPGIWSIRFRVGSNNCSVKIQATSRMGFVMTVQSKAKEDQPDTDYKTLDRLPSVAESVGITLDRYGIAAGDHVTSVDLVNKRGRILHSRSLSKSEDEQASIRQLFPDGISGFDPFYVMVQGVDSKGFKFQRVQPRLFSPSHVHIDCDFSNVIFRAGVESRVNITVHNYGPDDDLVITTSDEHDASYFHDFEKSKKVSVPHNGKATKTLSVKVNEKTKDGTAVKITLTSKGKRPGSFQYTICTVVVGQRKKPRIDSFSVKATINARFAETVVTSVVTNNADVGREAEFDILLPVDAFITGITIKLANETIHGQIEEKKKAKKVYDKAKEVGTVAGHVAARDKSQRAYRTSMFVEPRQNVQFILTYQQLLRRVRGKYEYAVVINPDQPIRDMVVDIHIAEEGRLSFVRALPLKTTQTNLIQSDPPEGTTITLSRHDMSAHIHYEPSIEAQTKWSPKGLSGTFAVEYDVTRSEMFGQVSINNGYFAHFFAPPPELPINPKIVVFVMDTSGSMFGYKMAQMKEALSAVLRDLRKEDRFNLVMFGDDAETWIKDTMTPAVPSSIRDAETFLREVEPRGGTNIAKALDVAVKLLKPFLPPVEEEEGSSVGENLSPVNTPVGSKVMDQEPELLVSESKLETVAETIAMKTSVLDTDMDNYAKMIVLLTDGRPSVGEIDTKTIVNDVKEKNKNRFTLHTLGFGSLVDSGFLTKLAASNGGQSRQIFEGIDADAQVD